MKIVRVLTFLKIIRLAKLIETAKELKKPQISVDVNSLTLSQIFLGRRRLNNQIATLTNNKNKNSFKILLIILKKTKTINLLT